MRISRDEYHGFQENWDRQTRQLLDARQQQRFMRETLEHFSPEEALVLGAALDRLIPQTDEERIDLVGFLDWALDKPLGRGDRQEGLPAEPELIHRGVQGLQESAQARFNKPFPELTADEQAAVLEDIQQGRARGATWQEIPSGVFFSHLLMKAVTGFCAHPLVWLRMGFPGPSYPEGYVWVGRAEVLARRRHRPGWKTL